MRKATRVALLTSALLALLAPQARAIITFTQLDATTFSVSHRVKVIGSRAKATQMVYMKASSLCVAAGYAYYQVLDQASAATQQYEAANATLTVRFFPEAGEDRISCQEGADPGYVVEAREKLQRKGYRPPDVEGTAAGPDPPDVEAGNVAGEATAQATQQATGETSATCLQSCTLEQVAAMARAGLSDEQIKAACEATAEPGAAEPPD